MGISHRGEGLGEGKRVLQVESAVTEVTSACRLIRECCGDHHRWEGRNGDRIGGTDGAAVQIPA